MGSTPLLSKVPAVAVRALAEQGTVREYRRGTYLFHQHDDAPSVYFLWRGRVEISSTSVTGHRQLHTALEPPQFFGELGDRLEVRLHERRPQHQILRRVAGDGQLGEGD